MRFPKDVYIHHPAGMPIYYRGCRGGTQRMHPGAQGLCCRCDDRLKPGSIVELTIPILNDAQRFIVQVESCSDTKYGREACVRFVDESDGFRARMTEQACHIEAYRRRVQEEQGRTLSAEGAAEEWIPRYAANFPP